MRWGRRVRTRILQIVDECDMSSQHAVSDSQTKLQSCQSLIFTRLFNRSVCHSVYFRTHRKHLDRSGSEVGALNLIAIVQLEHCQTLKRLGTCGHFGNWFQGVASSAMPLAMLAPCFPTS